MPKNGGATRRGSSGNVENRAGMGVEAARATTAEEFCKALKTAVSRKGPFLIELVM